MDVLSDYQTTYHTKKVDVAKKVNLKWEIDTLLIADQNNVIRTNYITAQIDKTQ